MNRAFCLILCLVGACARNGQFTADPVDPFCGDAAPAIAARVSNTCGTSGAFAVPTYADDYQRSMEVEAYLLATYEANQSTLVAAWAACVQGNSIETVDCGAFRDCLAGESVAWPATWPSNVPSTVETTCGTVVVEPRPVDNDDED